MPFSYDETEASVGQNTVNVPFPYLKRTHVNVSVDGVVQGQATLTWSSASVITLADPLVGGEVVRVYRSTPADLPAVTFQAGSFDHRDLNNTLLQMLYVVQEAYDYAIVTGELADSVVAVLAQAEALHADMEAYRDEVVGIDANLDAAVATATAARDLAIAAKDAAALSESSAAADAAATAADRLAVAADKVSVATDTAQVAADKLAAAASAAAALVSENNAAASKASAQALFDQFGDAWLGAHANPPTTDNDGSVLEEGDLYWDSTLKQWGAWDSVGLTWVYLVSGGSAGLITFTPAGTLTASNVQAALEELDSKKLATTDLGAASASAVAGATSVTTPADADNLMLIVGGLLRRLTWANLKATLKTYFDGLYTTAAAVAAAYQPLHERLTSLAGLAFQAGDLIYATGTNTLARLPKGAAGKILAMNAGGTAAEWADAPSSGWDMTGQAWQSVSRTSGTSYQNTTGKPIVVATYKAMGADTTCTLAVSSNNSTWITIVTHTTNSSGQAFIGVQAPVPPGWYYKITFGAGASVVELR